MNEVALFSTFAKGSQLRIVRGTNCVIYTRVSSKEQTENLSLASQRKTCHAYAEKRGYGVLASFGGTHESASNDERKEFQAMLSFVKKSKEKVSYILVASLERFSRNDNSIWLSGQLRKLGIEIVSVTQPIDTSGPSGQMQQKLLFLFGEFDNQLRKQKCTTGIKEMLSGGDWPTKPPLGYDSINVNGKRKIVINAKGKLLKQAFTWKQEGFTYDAIRDRLAEKGIKLCRQRVGAILRNPFYCGMIAHNMLEGKLVQGNHEPLISKELFLRVNGLLDQNTHGYTVQEENEHIPLKRFLVCEKCGRAMRGYIVHKKNIHYYKCCSIGCGNNRNANVLNQRFAELLEVFKLDMGDDLINLIKQQAIATFNQFTKGNEDACIQLQEQYKELKKKINRLEERFIEEEINADLYNKFAAKYADELKEIEAQLAKASNKVSNLDECIDLAVNFALNLPKKWLSADYSTKQRLQFLVFPEGISYSRETDRCRTTRINSVFSYIAYLKQVMLKQESGIPELNLDYTALSRSVAGAGLEPKTFGL
ncbi:MAG TPA: recombinase family protein [Mucilaginibacter sp.]|jgi:DNA invertase Pin-like site-specific DNA recombinase|nr:recombinase family protein [Mucilaginibacter sp.]